MEERERVGGSVPLVSNSLLPPTATFYIRMGLGDPAVFILIAPINNRCRRFSIQDPTEQSQPYFLLDLAAKVAAETPREDLILASEQGQLHSDIPTPAPFSTCLLGTPTELLL